MNADQFKGKWMQFKGELKQRYGKFTEDDLKQIEGRYDQFVVSLISPRSVGSPSLTVNLATDVLGSE